MRQYFIAKNEMDLIKLMNSCLEKTRKNEIKGLKNYFYFDSEKNRLIATNGMKLIVFNNQTICSGESGYFEPDGNVLVEADFCKSYFLIDSLLKKDRTFVDISSNCRIHSSAYSKDVFIHSLLERKIKHLIDPDLTKGVGFFDGGKLGLTGRAGESLYLIKGDVEMLIMPTSIAIDE